MSVNVTLIPIKPRGKLINRAQVMAALTAAVRDTQAEGVRLMATYPEAVSTSGYRRTNTLKRSWSMKPVKRTASRIEGEIGSAGSIAPYNEQVQGEEQTPFFRRRGWRGTKDLIALIQRQLPKRAQAEIDLAAS